MKKIKNLLFSGKGLAKIVFSFLIIGIFSLVFGPNIYAQFLRQTGSVGWGYGYGYGHGGVGIIGVILIIIVVLMLLGRI